MTCGDLNNCFIKNNEKISLTKPMSLFHREIKLFWFEKVWNGKGIVDNK